MRCDGTAEIALQHLTKPGDVLDRKGPIKAELLSQAGQVVRAHERPEKELGRVTRGEVQGEEQHDGNAKEHADKPEQTLQDVAAHRRAWPPHDSRMSSSTGSTCSLANSAEALFAISWSSRLAPISPSSARAWPTVSSRRLCPSML